MSANASRTSSLYASPAQRSHVGSMENLPELVRISEDSQSSTNNLQDHVNSRLGPEQVGCTDIEGARICKPKCSYPELAGT
jgi:hypothetical protein